MNTTQGFLSGMVGKLVYLLVASEPSIAFAVGQVSRFFSCLNSAHVVAVKIVLRYPKGVLPTQGLTFRAVMGVATKRGCCDPATKRSCNGIVLQLQ